MEFQLHVYGVYIGREGQHRVMGAGVVNVIHLKKWYNTVCIGIITVTFYKRI